MRPRPFRSASLFVLAALVFAPSAHAQRWRFIVTGDSRSERLHSTRKGDKNGVNVTILKELALATLRERPAFLLFSGDLAFGASSDAGVESQLRTWVSAMQPVYDARIPVYAIRGNHDIGGRHPAAVWRRVFQGRYAMPMNGPLGEEGMTYSVAYQNALIVGLDQYRTDTVRVNQTWLDE
ncbi:MAG: metallophosphoesterase, partial [Fimbriimonas ginsengisoli]|nr:metallophosphoesterase [Fimbriimonas ginsengisoli]